MVPYPHPCEFKLSNHPTSHRFSLLIALIIGTLVWMRVPFYGHNQGDQKFRKEVMEYVHRMDREGWRLVVALTYGEYWLFEKVKT